MPDLDNDGLPDLFYVTGNVYPEIERVLPQYPHRSPRFLFRNVGQGRFEPVTTAERRSLDPALQPRRRVRRHRQRRRHRRARDEHERAAVAAAERLFGQGVLDRDRVGGHAIESVGDWRGGRRFSRWTHAGEAVLSQSSYYSHDDFRLHFGLGDSRTIDRIEVRWPSGESQTLTNVDARRVLTIKETVSVELLS